ncbi:MAG: bifunctional diaminohydroxyphosphoribosylaminopyrimidine deaminase/5-amino-6-(5-phosphoribosylamino)uracil reductase RibD, partial [Flavobacteriales bacterium]|nr:bifunctional diaminohydroxyphosphoribosylaminopyrimidine deaminase/5-amino-6-(5-phosphoribosylamino)uracil reductase RibD [Flavobacteriales bacterium]
MNEIYMARCLELARLGHSHVAPNPMVGCVIVHEGKIIGEGCHQKFGEAHAEVNAIESVADPNLLSSSTLYVSLEPCTHVGKTPACTDLIVKSQIPNVIIGALDPNDQVSGNGAKYLQESNCKVEVGILEKECLAINKRFFTFHGEKRPYVILKWAQSKDGFMAPLAREQRWITGEESKRLVHKWRTEEQAILVGTNTAIVDNPKLTARLWEGPNPIRISIDNSGKIPAEANLFDGKAKTLLYGSSSNGGASQAETVALKEGPDQLRSLLADLYKRDIISIIVEGGSTLLKSFIDQRIWDEARVFTGPENFGDGLSSPDLKVDYTDTEAIGSDKLR